MERSSGDVHSYGYIPDRVYRKRSSVARVANQFAEDYELMFGRRMQVVQGRAAAGDFVFSSRPTAGWERKATR